MLYPTEEEIEEMFQRLCQEHIEPCETCNGTGRVPLETNWIEDKIPDTAFVDCDCKGYVHARLDVFEAGVPRNMWDVDEIDPEFNIKCFKVTRRFGDDLEHGRQKSKSFRAGLSLLLVGENGTGKTSSATIALLGALEGGFSAAMLSWPLLINGLYQNRFNLSIQKSLWSRLMRDMVILDEIGKETVPASAKDFVITTLDQVIRKRRGECLPTILITNYTLTQFSRQYGASVSSLIAPPYKVLAYKPGDYRRRLTASWDDFLNPEQHE